MKFDYDSIRDRLDAEFRDAVYTAKHGTPREELNRMLRNFYEQSDAPFILVRAKMLKMELDHVRCFVNDFDPFANIVERQNLHSNLITGELRLIQSERQRSIGEIHLPGAAPMPRFVGWGQADTSHTAPDWNNIISLGIPGLIRRAEVAFAARPEPFFEAVRTACCAIRDFVLRFAAIARNSQRQDTAEILDFLADNPPETLQQALQLSLIWRDVQEIEGEWVRSMGIFDRIYYPFYQHDIASGILTPAEAEELLCIYFARFHAQSRGKDAGTAFCFAEANELTRMAWRAMRRIGKVDPKFSLRVTPDTPDDLLCQIAECIKDGKNATVFANDTVAAEMFVKNGKDPADTANFVPIGCYEPAIMGKELCCSMAGVFNMAAICTMLWDDPEFSPRTPEDVEKRYLELLDKKLVELMQNIALREKAWFDINPAPVLSATMDECMHSGLDVTQGGTKYATSGIMCAGIGTVADTIAAIRYLVFDKKLLSFAELGNILRNNWENAELLRFEARNKAPKWGCGDPDVDKIAVKVAHAAADRINTTPNAKGDHYQMGLWSINYSRKFGIHTPATADGRKNGENISQNTGSTIGADREGIAGLMESVTKLDHTRFPDGAVLDVMLPSATVKGEEGTLLLCQLIRSFFARGGFFIHFNILSPETLKAAKLEPEKYRNLQIRLCGWNVRFIDLEPEVQDDLIRQAESMGN